VGIQVTAGFIILYYTFPAKRAQASASFLTVRADRCPIILQQISIEGMFKAISPQQVCEVWPHKENSWNTEALCSLAWVSVTRGFVLCGSICRECTQLKQEQRKSTELICLCVWLWEIQQEKNIAVYSFLFILIIKMSSYNTIWKRCQLNFICVISCFCIETSWIIRDNYVFFTGNICNLYIYIISYVYVCVYTVYTI